MGWPVLLATTPIEISLAIVSGFVTLVVGPLVTWKIATRNASGTVKPTEAATLWAESEQMRKEYREEALALRKEAVAMREEAVQGREELAKLRDEGRRLRSDMVQLRQEKEILFHENEALRKDLMHSMPNSPLDDDKGTTNG